MGKLRLFLTVGVGFVAAGCHRPIPVPACMADAGWVSGPTSGNTSLHCSTTQVCSYRHVDSIDGDPQALKVSDCQTLCQTDTCEAGDSPDGGYLVACRQGLQNCQG